MSVEQVEAIAATVPERQRAAVILAAGTGMRQGEVYGLTLDRVDFLRRSLRVDRQLVTVPGRAPFLGPPKTTALHRTIPLPQVVLDELAAHLAAYPPESQTVPVVHAGGRESSESVGLLFTTSAGKPIRRTSYAEAWRAAVAAVGAPGGTGMHAMRHFYASLLIRHGESVKTVQVRLGHATAAETLDTYAHLWPDSDDRTREAIDGVLGATAKSRVTPVSQTPS
ncbi:MAG: site-specific integrase [Nocardioides sp.]